MIEEIEDMLKVGKKSVALTGFSMGAKICYGFLQHVMTTMSNLT